MQVVYGLWCLQWWTLGKKLSLFRVFNHCIKNSKKTYWEGKKIKSLLRHLRFTVDYSSIALTREKNLYIYSQMLIMVVNCDCQRGRWSCVMFLNMPMVLEAVCQIFNHRLLFQLRASTYGNIGVQGSSLLQGLMGKMRIKSNSWICLVITWIFKESSSS